MQEKPWIVLFLACLLKFLREALAVPALPSYLCLWACECLAAHSAFKDGGRWAHCSLALPRLAAVLVLPAVALAGPSVLAELVLSHALNDALEWPTGLAAGLAALILLHGLWLISRHKQLPESLKIGVWPLVSGAADALLDLAALVALAFVGATLLRVPALVASLCEPPTDGEGPSGRELIFGNAILVFLDALCLPAAVVLAVCPWRWKAARQALGEELPRKALIGQAVEGAVDLLFLPLALVTSLHPWRAQRIARSCCDEGKRREVVAEEFGQLLADVICVPVLLAMLCMPWRLVWCIKDLCTLKDKGPSFVIVLFHFVHGIADLVAALAMIVVTPSHRVMELPWSSRSWHWRTSMDEADFGIDDSAHCQAFLQLTLLIVDVVICGPPFLVVLGSVYRLPALVKNLRKGRDHRIAVWRQFGLILIELPILCLSTVLLVTPWRVVWLVADIVRTKDVNVRRDAVFFHVGHAIADVLMILALLVLLVTAPHRLFAHSFRSRLPVALQHVGTSVEWTFRRPQPRLPVEGSTISAFHGTSPEAAEAIEKGGFKPSERGMIGKGVYVSRDPSKAESYGKTILRLEVEIGHLKVIDYQKHPSQQTWASEGYDLAWVPAGCGMVPSNREEGCIKDPTRIRVVGRYTKTNHPHALCVARAVQGLLDLVLGLPFFLLVAVTVYRLPNLLKELAELEQPCLQRLACAREAGLTLLDLIMGTLAVVLLAIAPWRFVQALIGDFGDDEEAKDWRVRVCSMFVVACVDLVSLPFALVLCLTVYRLPILSDDLRKTGVTGPRSYLNKGAAAPTFVLQHGIVLLCDLFCLLVALVTLCSWRCFYLIRRVSSFSATATDAGTMAPEASGSSEVALPPPQLRNAVTQEAVPADAASATVLGRPSFEPVCKPLGDDGAPEVTSPASLRAAAAAGTRSCSLSSHSGDGKAAATDGKDLEAGHAPSEASSSAALWNERLAHCRGVSIEAFSRALLDLLLVVALTLILALISRLPQLFMRCWRMLLALPLVESGAAADEPPPGWKDEAWSQAKKDVAKGLTILRELEHCKPGGYILSLAFFGDVIGDELGRSIVNAPALPFFPLFLISPLCSLLERYASVRFAPEAAAAPAAPSSALERCRKLPRCFLALPAAALGDAAGKAAARWSEFWSPWALAERLIECLFLLVLVALHEAATVLSLLVVLVVFTPLSLGYTFWPQTCKESWGGKVLIGGCYYAQTLSLPLLLVAALLLPALPFLLWWAPEEGWLSLDPPELRAPDWAHADAPEWPFWVAQTLWALTCLGAGELLARAPKTGAFQPACPAGQGARQLLWLITGKSVVWRRCADPVVGAVVSWSYRHRRTCGCLGELVVSIWLPAFALWPLALPAVCALGKPVGQAVAWWSIASLVAVFFMFHAVRIGKAFWK